jgi:site-specific recombinase XerD
MTPSPPEHADLLDAFSAYDAAVLGSAPNTVRNRRIYLTAFLRWWADHGSGRALAEATAADVSAFLVAEAERGLSARTRRAELAAVRRLFAWLLLRGLCGDNPATLVPSPKAPPLHTDIYPSAQIRQILAHTAALTDVRGRQRHAIVATLRYSGMRSGELRTLRSRDLDLAAGRAMVFGKGARQRIVLLPPALVPTLTEFLAEVRPLLPDSPLLLANAHPFVTTAQHGFGTDALAREVELAGLGAGVPGRHYPHKWRHTYATELVRAGVDIHVVQRLLGHDHIASTVGYLHLALDDLRSAVAGLWDAA